MSLIQRPALCFFWRHISAGGQFCRQPRVGLSVGILNACVSEVGLPDERRYRSLYILTFYPRLPAHTTRSWKYHPQTFAEAENQTHSGS